VYSGEAASFEIVGVIADERLTPFDDKREHAAIYVSNEQDARGFAGVVVRTSLEPSSIQRGLQAAIAAVDKDQAVTDVKTLDQLKSDSMLPDRLRSTLIGVFAALALALSAVGIYGVIAYSVVQRTQEIGIRAALGATPANLVRLIVGGGLWLTGAGLGLGCVGSIGVNRLLSSFLFGVGSSDSVTLIVTAGVLTGVAIVACYIPARHATGIDPLTALRTE
jgi:putative ABC transport system permease protein